VTVWFLEEFFQHEDLADLLFAWNFDPSPDGVRRLGAGDGAA